MTQQQYSGSDNDVIVNDNASMTSLSSLPSSQLLSEENIYVDKSAVVNNNAHDVCDFDTAKMTQENGFSQHDEQKYEQQQRCSFENDKGYHQSIPLIMKAFPFTTLLTFVLLYIIHSEPTYQNHNFSNGNHQQQFFKSAPAPSITTRILNSDNSTDESGDKTEILCRKEYSSVADLSYTYYLETQTGTDVPQTIKELEMVMLHHLTDALLFCSYETRQRDRQKRRRKLQWKNGYSRQESGEDSLYDNEGFMDRLIEDYSLKIVGVSSTPNDVPSTKSKYRL